jgi:tryptophan synthase alpha chain
MTRLATAFAHRPIFMPYYPLGYPDLATSVQVLAALARGGADVIEVGLAFSDPLADGPVIQRATQVALEQGLTLNRALQAVAELRAQGVTIPLILMGYYNPMLAYGLTRFIRVAAESGADGFIVPDLPPEEAAEFEAASTAAGAALPLIRMLAPTTPPARIAAIAREARGFLYLVSLTGLTGTRAAVSAELPAFIAQARQSATIPVCVGFGISTPAQARDVGQLADGVIVGSACVKTMGEAADPVKAAEEFARGFKEALR